MRIIGGRHKGRHLTSLVGPKTRPTADRTRETIFNILLHRCLPQTGQISLEGMQVLDVFAGTGALGLEALSRGASHVFFVEKDKKAITTLRQNAERLGETSQITSYTCDAASLPSTQEPCDLIFLDPPYHKNLLLPTLERLHKQGWAAPGTWVVAEVGAKETPSFPPAYHLETERICGAARVYFLRRCCMEKGG